MDEAMDIKAVLEDALKELHTLSTRAELQDGCYEMRIDFGTVLQFDSPEWELILGSLGAGKTILLKAWEEEVHSGVARPKVLPIYVSADRLRGAPGAQASEPGARAEAHFIAFLKQFAEAVNVAAQKLRERDRDDGVGSRRLKRQAELIEDLLDAVQRAVSEGRVVDLPANATQEEERVEEEEERSKVVGWFRAWWAAVLESLSAAGANARARAVRWRAGAYTAAAASNPTSARPASDSRTWPRRWRSNASASCSTSGRRSTPGFSPGSPSGCSTASALTRGSPSRSPPTGPTRASATRRWGSAFASARTLRTRGRSTNRGCPKPILWPSWNSSC
jgi:hypothetical protein